jgi:pimeloyl-ACP methyl ester carboxylesterase
MSSQETLITTHSVETPSGRISYASAGSGPAALFVHGVVLNKHLWRHQLAGLSDIRRCIAVDLLAHGDTEIAPDQDASVTANAKMLKEVLDALKIDQVDLVGNDSGGGIAQIFAALNLERVRTLTLTNCDTHDNWPPEAFKPFVDMVKAGGLRDTLNAMLADKTIFRSPGALGPADERPETVTDEEIETYLRPLVRSQQRTHDLERFVAAFDNKHTVAIEPRLRQLQAPTLICLGDRRPLLPGEVGTLARRGDPWSEAAGGVARRPDLLAGRASCRVQPSAARSSRRLRTPRGANALRRLARVSGSGPRHPSWKDAAPPKAVYGASSAGHP